MVGVLKKIFSPLLWANLLLMAAVAAAIGVGVKMGLDAYTMHGKAAEVPKLTGMGLQAAMEAAGAAGVEVEVVDSGYSKTLPPGTVLDQDIEPGSLVKAGRRVAVTVSSPHSPTLTLPDIVENSSLRAAMARLSAMGFKLAEPEYVPGEKDWVYGAKVAGRPVAGGDKVPAESPVTIVAGSGSISEDEDISYVGAEDEEEPAMDEGGMDDFEEVPPPAPADENVGETE